MAVAIIIIIILYAHNYSLTVMTNLKHLNLSLCEICIIFFYVKIIAVKNVFIIIIIIIIIIGLLILLKSWGIFCNPSLQCSWLFSRDFLVVRYITSFRHTTTVNELEYFKETIYIPATLAPPHQETLAWQPRKGYGCT